MCGNSAQLWNTMLTLRSSGQSVVTSRPAMKICPELGASSPAIIRKVVVLPPPLGPRMVVSVPCGTVKLMPFDDQRRARIVAVALRDVAKLDAVGGHGCLE